MSAARDLRSHKLECLKCKESHTVEDGNAFKRTKIPEKLTFLKERGVCFACLRIGHRTNGCIKAPTCKIDDCIIADKFGNTLEHRDNLSDTTTIEDCSLHTQNHRFLYNNVTLLVHH